jgi:hypothetical protein
MPYGYIMNTLLWVLVGILLYTSVAMALNSRGLLPDSVKVGCQTNENKHQIGGIA